MFEYSMAGALVWEAYATLSSVNTAYECAFHLSAPSDARLLGGYGLDGQESYVLRIMSTSSEKTDAAVLAGRPSASCADMIGKVMPWFPVIYISASISVTARARD